MDESRRCTARSSRTGAQCKRAAIAGGTVCSTHGGRASQVVAAAERRLAAERARADLAKMGVAIETTPVEALEAMLNEAAGNVAVLREMVAEFERDQLYGLLYHHTGEPTGEAKPHVLVVLYNAERDRLTRIAKDCAALGIEARKAALQEASVERLYRAVTRALAKTLGSDQQEAVRVAIAHELRTGGA